MFDNFDLIKRNSDETVNNEYELLSNLSYMKDILDALPYIGCIINQNRQVVFTNKSLLNILNKKDYQSCIGKRPGELIQCKYAMESEFGCGTSKNCRLCGAFISIMHALEKNEISENECRITSNVNGEDIVFDLRVSAKPIIIRDTRYIMLTILDISSEKRRFALERIFFHDVANTAGGLFGLAKYLVEEHPQSLKPEMLDLFNETCRQLLEQISEQKDLIAAENGNLEVSLKTVPVKDVLLDLEKQFSHHSLTLSKDIRILVDHESADYSISTEPTTLKRILGYALKNAIEASNRNGAVSVKSEMISSQIVFRVHNQTEMDEVAKMQIFHRSFSTKGANRGLGTYSMKLLTEKYLKGKIEFQSNSENGTTFFIKLPLEI